MKALLKSLTVGILFVLAIGAILGAYILQAPPVAQPGPPKLQIHTRTALRRRPTVDSKPLAYTKDVYRFSLTRMHMSNLSTGEFRAETAVQRGIDAARNVGRQTVGHRIAERHRLGKNVCRFHGERSV